MDINTLYDLAFQILPRVPIIIVVVGAAGVALARRARHPKVSDLVVAFAAIEIGLQIASTILYTQLPSIAVRAGYKPQDLRTIFAIVGFVHSALYAAALSLLLYAALGWRGQSRTP